MVKKKFDVAHWREYEFLSINHIAEILDISRGKAQCVMHTLPHLKIGNTLRVKREAFEKWVKAQERSTARG